MCAPMSERSIETDIAIVGAGPAGIAAACAAAESGKRVLVVDDTPWLGGQIWRGEQRHPTSPEASQWLQRFRDSGAELLDSTSVIALPALGTLLAERLSRESISIQYQRLILATGARELFLPFPGWTLPGVMGVGGLQALAKNGWPVEGRRVVIAGSGPLLLAVADGLRRKGAEIVTVAEQAPLGQVLGFATSLVRYPSKLWQGMQIRSRLLDVPYQLGTWPMKAEATGKELLVTLTDGRDRWTEPCDYLACGFGLVPNIELPLAAGCELTSGGFLAVDSYQQSSIPGIYCAGEPVGIGGVDCALIEGQIAGHSAAGALEQASKLMDRRDRWHLFRLALAKGFALRDELRSLASSDTLICRCEDVPVGRVGEFDGWREAKLHTRCGMGACQGRICGSAAKVLFGWGMQSVRPPILPAKVQSLLSTT